MQKQSPKPKHVWNRILEEVRLNVVKLALSETELSPRELVETFTDQESYFVSESALYRVLNVHELITSPPFTRIKVGIEIKDKTMAINQLWQPDFTQLQSALLGLVPSQPDPRRFQRLLHFMEAVHKHTG